jgi:FKBP-type peptidyl-prolyl cis-trans isomerase 2
MNNMLEEAEKEGYREDPFRRMEQGKSSPAFSVENWVTSQEIADKNDMAIKDYHAQGKPMTQKKKQWSHDKLQMKEPPNKGPQICYQGWLTRTIQKKTSSCRNCGGRRIFKMPKPNGLGEGSSL